ncbi:DUF58 domain-containing protein [Nocardioides sambongensis]|uniref:DUF58 domain-containing protein n=1 Tax=Nocardioides sambongensis TaxID=2589074 RepID=UPI00112EF339|nr:DUF58 domain-containing protein [Nocardioides sambongensis]
MRDGLSGLTLRGRAFLAAGVTAVVCSVLLGQTSLARIGVLIIALPLLSAALVGWRRHEIEVQREVAPRLVTAGQAATVRLTLAEAGRGRAGTLLVEDQIPYALGSRTRYVLTGLTRGWRRHLAYQVRSDVRGQFEIGPVTSRSTDPFGLVEVQRLHPGSQSLTVTPRTVPLPPIGLAGGWSGTGDHRPQSFASGSAEDVSVREYRRGDELRRVHWRSSARVGELMVRREEQPWEARAVVLLDTRRSAHRGRGMASSFEAAVSAAASVAAHLDQHGYTVQLVTSDGTSIPQGETLTVILERLALIQPTPRPRLDAAWSRDTSRGGLVIAVLGDSGHDDAPALRRIRHDSGAAFAIELDVSAWASARQSSAAPHGPRAGSLGWRAVTIGPRDRLDVAWRELGRSRHRAHGAVRPSATEQDGDRADRTEVGT